MKKIFLLVLTVALGVPAGEASLTLARTIPLGGIEGRIDHFGYDPAGGRLFVAALGNNTVEVVNLKQGKVVHSISGLSEPQGIFFVPEFNRLYIANGGDGALRIYDGTDFSPITTVKLDDDADNVRYDAVAKRIYVGYGSGAIAIVDAAKNVKAGEIPVSAHPESFQLEKSGSRIFINVPGAHNVTVADRNEKITAGKWSLGLVAANFPMALDEADHRVFVGCRLPARLLVFDTEAGKEVAKLDLHGDCDDVFYDPSRHQIYASCGEGFIDVFAQADADHYSLKESIPTVHRARTCLFADDHLYLAVPRRGEETAEIRDYSIGR
ncbi:MAG TPA: YncE family protein [Opitutaceae bacterium]|nr:YncE family protein [Opitutaceae bacterium]